MKHRSKHHLSQETDRSFMRRALALAERGRGVTPPNPMVGAVVVKGEKIVGEGYHRRAGGRHAEIMALSAAGRAARGAILYVTLEPCAHTGQTGPCVEALIAAGIAEVRYAIVDPDPRVNGAGARRLRAAGVRVSRGTLAARAENLNEIYLNRHRRDRPFVILKTAQTLDGRIACANGHSQWISGAASRRFAHRLRAEVDAVVVGAGTANQDDPRLTVRLVRGKNPYRIVMSSTGKVRTSLRLFTENHDRRTILATGVRRAPAQLRAREGLIFWTVRLEGTALSLPDFLEKARGFGINSLLIEGGARLGTSFLRAGLVDKHVVSLAPRTLGSGIDAVADLGSRRITDAISYNRVQFSSLGEDMLFSGYPQNRLN